MYNSPAMEPRIQYAKTQDGVSIAYWTMGEGMPLVSMPFIPFSHIQLECQTPEYGRWHEAMMQGRRLIHYDNRGSGLSERDVTDFSLDNHMLDLEAVADSLALERFALFAASWAGAVAIAYVVRHPERISHLILWCSWAGASEVYESSQLRATASLREQDWEVYTETLARLSSGWSLGEEASRVAALTREAVTQETAIAFHDAAMEFDVTSLLPQVSAPTLVLHRRQVEFPKVDSSRRLAAQIPDARLALLEGTEYSGFAGDMDAVMRAIEEFLGEGEEAAAGAELPEGMAVILFADIADSTALTEQLGDAAFRTKATGLDSLLRKLIREADGTPVEGKVLGDGVMAVFSSARQAIDCALRCKQAGDAGGLPLHLGIHAGDVIREGNTVYGGAVNLAQRITDASAPGEILVSDTLRGLARTSAEVGFEDRGEHELKGIPEPQRLFAVRESAGGGQWSRASSTQRQKMA